MVDFVYDSHCVLGKNRPNIRFIRSGDDRIAYSVSNWNLYLLRRDFDPQGTLTVAALLSGPGLGVSLGSLDPRHRLPSCSGCYWGNELCPMLAREVKRRQYAPDQHKDTALSAVQIDLWDEPQFDKCPCLSSMMAEVQSEAELKLFKLYYTFAICGVQNGGDRLETLGRGNQFYARFVAAWEQRQAVLKEEYHRPEAVTAAIIQSFKAPALLPQYWLNWTYNSAVPPSDRPVELKDAPNRVDFVTYFKGTRHIVEVDDLSHYSRFDSNLRVNVADETKFTQMLREGRYLRAEKWNIHRFSNWEVLAEGDLALTDLIWEVGIGSDVFHYNPTPSIPGVYYEDRG